MRLFYLLLFSAFYFGLSAQGIEFYTGGWEQALERAAKEKKIIFVDAYASWCGPCKRMAKNVFTQSSVGDFYNANFINLKLDMEKAEASAFKKLFPVRSFPTLFYIDYNGELVLQVVGGQSVEGFIDIGKKAMAQLDESKDMAVLYEEGKRDPEFVHEYVKALNKAGKPSLRVANMYLLDQKDLTTPFNIQFIADALTECDSRIFDLFVKNQKAIQSAIGQEAYLDKIQAACQKTFDKALVYESEDLKEESISKMKKYCSKESKAFEQRADMDFARYMQKPEEYLKFCKIYAGKSVKEDYKELDRLAGEMWTFFSANDEIRAQALKYSQKTARAMIDPAYNLNYVQYLIKVGDKQEALQAIDEAIDLCKAQENSTLIRAFDRMKKQLSS